jgi:hypothetical protein
MHLKHVTPRPVEPGKNHEFITDSDAHKPLGKRSLQVQPGFGRAFVTLKRSGVKTGQLGAD